MGWPQAAGPTGCAVLTCSFLDAGTAGPFAHASAIDVLAAFVAVNTLMYVCLALVKMLPRVRLPTALRRPYSRSETRSIYPTEPR
jgi:hypothetical protein